MTVTLAIDCMGGDHGPSVTVPAALNFLRKDTDCSVILVGRSADIEAHLGQAAHQFGERLVIHHASEVVEMTDPVATAMRLKKDSSMRVAVDLVKSGTAQAAVSAGNTGALMAISRFVLKTLPGIDRPAIATAMPNIKGYSYVLDLGANVDCEPEHLLQFAVMGAQLVAALEHKERPSIGLLNIGEEIIKGNDVVKRAGELLRDSGLNFYGNVEGDDIFEGTVDLVVCDGFVGNVTLKASEGLAQMVFQTLKDEFTRNLFTRFAALMALPVLKSFKRRFDPRRYNGAGLLGLRGVVIKSHGSADSVGFFNALERAAEAARNRVPERIAERMAQLPPALTAASPATSVPTQANEAPLATAQA